MPQKSLEPLPANLNFKGKTVVITGTTNGIGLAAAEELVHRHAATMIMGVRNVAAGEELKMRLCAQPGCQTTIHVIKLEQAELQSVVAFANAVTMITSTVDIAVLNAGIGGMKFELTKDGHEKIIQVNLISTSLLAMEMLPILEATAKAKGVPSRLTWVGSFTQSQNTLKKKPVPAGKAILAHFDEKASFAAISRYPDSKFLGTLIVQELAKKIDKSQVILNEVSPGQVATNFGHTLPWYLRGVLSLVVLVMKGRPVAEAASTYFHAFAIVGEETHGKYLSDNEVTP
jgi:NAD(P)-dependent dehydrogenase (short-subunit alcohol dehydrogenase family)